MKGDFENSLKTTAIIAFDIINKTTKEYESIKQAVEELHLTQSNIVMCCKGLRNRVKNYIFRYRGDKFRKSLLGGGIDG